MKIGVLNNLRAGKRDSRVDAVLGLLARHPEVEHIETGHDSVVPEALAVFEREGVEILVLNGGDGTVQMALTHLLTEGSSRWQPMIAPIRGGRTNMTALDIGARRDPVRSLADLIEAARRDDVADRIVERPVLRIELPREREVRCGMFLGAGMLHRAVDMTHRVFPEGKSQGVLGAGLVTGVLITRAAQGKLQGVLAPDKLRLASDGVAAAPEAMLLAMVSTLDRLFLRMRPFWGREPAPVRVTMIASGAERVGRAAPGILRGAQPAWATPERGYQSMNVRELVMQLDAGLVLDGELIEPQPDRVIRISAIEGVRFLRG